LENQDDQTVRDQALMENAAYHFPNYLSGLSHDIRTPLSAIIGFSDLLAEPRVSRADQRSYCLMIGRSSRKLLELMSNLIDLAKMETNNLELFYKPVYLKDFVDEMKSDINEMVNLYEKGYLNISFIAPTNATASVFTDKTRLFQVVKILMENGLRYTKQGGVTMTILQDAPSTCTIEVRDTGCGMDAATLEQLFVMFPPQDTPLGRKMKARGMSMSVVKKLCDKMGIRIDVSSIMGEGTVIQLIVPFKEQ
jgi:signal transduction histidine kinase